MNDRAYQKLMALAAQPENMEKTIGYVAEHLGRFLKQRDKVMILFPDEPYAVGHIMKEAVIRCGAQPQFLDGDHRWRTILKTAFLTRSDAIIGTPLTMLGLAKVAKYMSTPLFARNVLVAGYPSQDWMINGIQHGLDCRVWGLYDPGMGTVIAGCGCPGGHIHLWSEQYEVIIADSAGNALPEGKAGRILLSHRDHPEIRFDTGDLGALDTSGCTCGWESPRLIHVDSNNGTDPRLSKMGEDFHYWNSILDCRIFKSRYGIELELVVFPGEQLPKLPECARLVVRAWNPESDEPFPHAYVLKEQHFSQETH